MLPQQFLERMQKFFGEEYHAFLASYERPRVHALRLNPQKTQTAHFLEKPFFHLEPVPWARDGFFYAPGEEPGKHPYHAAGVYYIQEPSAMAPAEYLFGDGEADTAPTEQERVLDLCAAPGGKSTQIAARMAGKGILLCNEIHPARAKILSENMERLGVANAMVTNEPPERLAEIFDGYFTGILVDAPCSGEGMFKKNEEAKEEWSMENIALCADRQDGILDCAASMLSAGGKLVYSTCTFAPEENEGTITRFLHRHPEFVVEKVKRYPGMEGGRPEWYEGALPTVRDTVRLFPHHIDGEGHFLAVLRKAGQRGASEAGFFRRFGLEQGMSQKDRRQPGGGVLEWEAFARETLQKSFGGNYLRFGDQLYLAPEGMPSIRQLKVLRPGLHLGTIKKNRLEPSHALALYLHPGQVKHCVDLPADGEEIRAYLSGQALKREGEKGWYLVTVDGYSIGWAKQAGGVLKNHYPKGLRIHYV